MLTCANTGNENEEHFFSTVKKSCDGEGKTSQKP